jgi:hypothetical protein
MPGSRDQTPRSREYRFLKTRLVTAGNEHDARQPPTAGCSNMRSRAWHVIFLLRHGPALVGIALSVRRRGCLQPSPCAARPCGCRRPAGARLCVEDAWYEFQRRHCVAFGRGRAVLPFGQSAVNHGRRPRRAPRCARCASSSSSSPSTRSSSLQLMRHDLHYLCVIRTVVLAQAADGTMPLSYGRPPAPPLAVFLPWSLNSSSCFSASLASRRSSVRLHWSIVRCYSYICI